MIDENARVVVQGITGRQGAFHTERMLAYGTPIVAGISPGKDGQTLLGVPVFGTVRKAVEKTGAAASVVFVPPAQATKAMLEAVDAGIGTIVCITEGVPVLDAVRIVNAARQGRSRLIGPNCPGVLVPGKTKIGIIPDGIATPGPVAVLSRSGTLLYEAVAQMSEQGVGQSVCIVLGGDPVLGTRFADGLEWFRGHPATGAVLLIGEIGGSDEEEAADLIRRGYPKPVFAYIAGLTAPPETRMGHAGALVSAGRGDAASKIGALRDAGARIIESPAEIGVAVRSFLEKDERRI